MQSFNNVSIPHTPKALDQVGTPHLLYVSSWEQPSTMLPRSLHSHSDLAEFTFILSGEGVCELNGLLYPITKGDLIICNQGILHDEFVDPRKISLISVAANGICLPGLPENCVIPQNTVPIIHLDSRASGFRHLVCMLADTVRSSDARRGLTCQALFLALFYQVLDVIDAYCRRPTEAADRILDMDHQIRAYIDAHITENLSMHAIAAEFQISTSYLGRIFKRSVGCPMSKYIIRRRLGEAQTLLLNTTLPVSEISQRVGYPNQSYFTKLFTQAFGVSPLQYRKISSERLINLPDSK